MKICVQNILPVSNKKPSSDKINVEKRENNENIKMNQIL